MSRLLRPSIPLEVKLRVLCRQLGEMFVDEVVRVAIVKRSLGQFVRNRLERLAELLNCDVADLHLDHDPALVNREKEVELAGVRSWKPRRRCVVVPKGAVVVRYFPDANDPEHLIYRVGRLTGSEHDVKTRVRGEHGQHSDLALARKNKRIQKRLDGADERRQKPRFAPGRKIQSRGFPKVHRPMRRKP